MLNVLMIYSLINDLKSKATLPAQIARLRGCVLIRLYVTQTVSLRPAQANSLRYNLGHYPRKK